MFPDRDDHMAQPRRGQDQARPFNLHPEEVQEGVDGQVVLADLEFQARQLLRGFNAEGGDAGLGQGVIGSAAALLLVGAVRRPGPGVEEVEELERLVYLPVDPGDDLFGVVGQGYDPARGFMLVGFGVGYDALAVAFGIGQFAFIGGAVIAGAVVEVQEKVALMDQALDEGHYVPVGIIAQVAPELAVHVPFRAPVEAGDGLEIGPGQDDEVAALQGNVGVEIGAQKTARLVPLDAAQDHDGGAGLPAVNLVNLHGPGRPGPVNQVLTFGCPRRERGGRQDKDKRRQTGYMTPLQGWTIFFMTIRPSLDWAATIIARISPPAGVLSWPAMYLEERML